MEKQIPEATYKFEIPFLFCGKEYFNSADLAMALIEHWDIGLMAAKRGEFAAFFDYHAEEDASFREIAEVSKKFFLDLHRGGDKMQDAGEDVEYSGFLCKLEENIPGIPVIRFGATKGEILDADAWDKWEISSGGEQKERPVVANERWWNGWIWTAYNNSELVKRI